MQANIEDWDVCPFGLDEIQYQRDNDIAYQDYVQTLDSDRSKDWDFDLDYGCITNDIFDKFVKYCKQPQIKEVISTLQADTYKITKKIEVIDTKIDALLIKKANMQNSKMRGHVNKHINLLQRKKNILNNDLSQNDKNLDVYSIENFMLKN